MEVLEGLEESCLLDGLTDPHYLDDELWLVLSGKRNPQGLSVLLSDLHPRGYSGSSSQPNLPQNFPP